jgi:hypothetical protein
MTEKDLTGLEDLSGLFMYARGEIRTRNRRIRSPALYPLSYSGKKVVSGQSLLTADHRRVADGRRTRNHWIHSPALCH